MAHHQPKLLNLHAEEKTKTNTNTLKKMERKAIQDSLLTHVIAAVGFAKGSFFFSQNK